MTELIARKTRQRIPGFEQACKPAGDCERIELPERCRRVVTCLVYLKVPGKTKGSFKPVNEQFAVGQARRKSLLTNRVKQSFLGGLEISHVGEPAHEPDNLAIGSDHGARLQREP